MKEMTRGYPAKVILRFAIPLMLGNILQQVYNITDSKIVSHFIGSDALAAVGATAIISNTLTGFINGSTQGFAILVSRSLGEKNPEGMRSYVAGAVRLTLLYIVLLTAFGELFIGSFLKLLNTPADIIKDAREYIMIIIAGIFCISVYNFCANILRSVGDTLRPLICLMLSLAVNLGLDLLFVAVFRFGIRGAAYATVIAQAVSAAACVFFFVHRYPELIPGRTEMRVPASRLRALFTNGLSMGLMGCIVNIGSIILQSAINGLGTVYITAQTAGRRVFDIMMIMIFTIGLSMTTYVSQNLGAGEYGRIRQGIRHALLLDTGITTVLIAFTYAFGERLVRWILSSTDSVMVNAGTRYIEWGVLFFYVLGPLFILRCSLQGLGRKIVPLVSSGLELLTKVIFALVLVPHFGYNGVILTEPVSWIIMIVPLIIVYWRHRPGGEKSGSENRS